MAMRERPMLMSAPMVCAILDGTKTQTRRIVKPQPTGFIGGPGVIMPNGTPAALMPMDDTVAPFGRQIICPYGQPGDRLLCYHCAHEHTSPRTSPDSGIPERRLHGGVGRADLQPHQVRGVRSQDPSGLVSAQGARHEEGLRDDHHVARRKEGNEGGSSVGLHGLSRHAADAERGDAAPGWQRVKQCAGQPLLGNGGRELAGQAHARDCGDGREAPRSEVHGCGTGAYPLGNQQGLVQPAARGACAGCGAVVDSGHRIGGDRLYVREAWAAPHAYDHLPPRLIPQDARIHYAATEDRGGLLWRPSIHMPRWASRISLEITIVRVERLQDISEADARAEGCQRLDDDEPGYIHRDEPDWVLCPRCGGTRLYIAFNPATGGALPDTDCTECDTYAKRYRHLWESINGAESWAANPWVWVVEFKRIKP